MQQKHLFENYAHCKVCKRPLPSDYTEELCPTCKEQHLFHQVKDFIRKNDVTEYQVAAEFGLPLSRVKEWIREGRIEYKESPTPGRQLTTHCQICGSPLSFGTVCQKCLKQKRQTGTAAPVTTASGNMRHLNQKPDSEKKH